MRPLRVLLLATIVTLTGGLRPAAAGGGFQCTSVHDVDLAPGLSIHPSSGTVSAPTGTIECRGTVNGHTPTGAGPYSEEARYGTRDPDTCQDGGEGEGRFSFTLPTTGGDQQVARSFTFTYGELSTRGGVVSGSFEGEGVTGTLEVTPLEGDCVTEPITRIRVEAAFFFSE